MSVCVCVCVCVCVDICIHIYSYSYTHILTHTDTHTGAPHRIRVGWVSSNIGDHSLTHLMRSVFGMHGRKVASYVFALNGDNDPGDPIWRKQVKAAVGDTNFIDMSQMSGVQGAHVVNQKKIHVLVDLVGYTGGGERANEVFASQPSELQTSYMGFCASTGAPYMQHMIADRIVAPAEHQAQFSERLMIVPNSYFCNDHRQQEAWAHVGRAAPPSTPAGTAYIIYIHSCMRMYVYTYAYLLRPNQSTHYFT